MAGQLWVGATLTIFPGPDGIMGGLAAFNPITNKKLWYNKERFPIGSGVLGTASDLVFYGTLDRWFKAVDATTGKEQWKAHIGSGSVGNSFTYSQKGNQYIGIMSGNGGKWAEWALTQAIWAENCHCAMAASDANAALYKYNARPSGGALNIFSL